MINIEKKYKISGVDIIPEITNDKQNVLVVSNKTEVFFDVFECTINGKKILVEKIDEVNNLPLVQFELFVDNHKRTCKAILVEDVNNGIYFNSKTLGLEKSKIQYNNIVEQTSNNKNSIENYSKEIIKSSKQQAKQFTINEDKKQINKQVKLVLGTKLDSIKNSIDEKYKAFSGNDVERKTQIKLLEKKLNSIRETTKEDVDFIYDKIQIDINNTKNSIDEKYKAFSGNDVERKTQIKLLEKKLNSIRKTTKEDVDTIYGKIQIDINNTKNSIVENTKNSIDNVKHYIKEQIKTTNQNILSESHEKYTILENKFDSIKINANQNILKEDVKPLLLSEKKNSPDMLKFTSEIKTDISNRFKNEMTSIKRLVEMSSGGGSVAVQYANGGVMNGDLTINGNLQVSDTINTDILSATAIYATSSFTTYIDIKEYELSGFSVTGNVSISGDLTVTENINLSGNLNIDGLVDGRDIAADGAAIDNLELDVTFLSGSIDNTNADVDFLSGSIDDTNADVDFLSGSIDNTNADVDFLSGSIDNTNADVDFLSGSIDNTNADVTFLSGSIDDTNADVTFLSGSIDNIDLQQVTTVDNTTTNSIQVASLTATGKIIGGNNNTATGDFAAVLGGVYNQAKGNYTNVAGGSANTTDSFAAYSNIAGGCNNLASGDSSNIGGGRCNEASSPVSTVAGGELNQANGGCSNVAGGYLNCAESGHSNIAGGFQNKANCNASNVAGGRGNQACGFISNVAGGQLNQAKGYQSNVAGGFQNKACGIESNVGGGRFNEACADYSAILGGTCSTILPDHEKSFIIGSNLTSSLSNTTFVNNLSAQGSLHAGDGFTGNIAGCTSIIVTNGIITSAT